MAVGACPRHRRARARPRRRRRPGPRALARELGGEAVGSNAELAERSDVVVLCHKPAQLEEVAGAGGGACAAVASILAATPTAASRRAYPGRARLPLHPEHPRRGPPGRALLRARHRSPPRAPRRSCSSCSAAPGRSSRSTTSPDRARDGPDELRPRVHGARGGVLRRGRRRARAGARRRRPHDGRDDGRHGRVARDAHDYDLEDLRRACGHPRRRDRARPAARSRSGGLRDVCRAAVDAVVEGTRDDVLPGASRA